MKKFFYEFIADDKTRGIKIANMSNDYRLLSAPRDVRQEKCYSYSLHYSDIKHAIMYLEKAIQIEDVIVKESLFESAIIRYIKCFTSSKSGRKQLHPNKVYKGVPGEPLECHTKFKEMRDSYIAHDQNDFLDIRMGLVVRENELEGVVCPPVQTTFLYEENINILLTLCQYAYCFVNNVLDEETDKIHQQYIATWGSETVKAFSEMEWKRPNPL